MGEGGATYAGAGVDIAAGDAAVERLRGMVRGIGGFGGQFPLDTGRFRAPVLVASTDGVGTKLKLGIDTGLVYGGKLSCLELSEGLVYQLARGSQQVKKSRLEPE